MTNSVGAIYNSANSTRSAMDQLAVAVFKQIQQSQNRQTQALVQMINDMTNLSRTKLHSDSESGTVIDVSV